MGSPPVTVILPVYNCRPYLSECLDSLLAQTFHNFELLIIDDGSTDNSAMLIREYAARDNRIRAQFNRVNRGLIAVLNDAVASCDSRYVARMDADDWCEPERLALQYTFLEAHPEVAIVGSWIQLFGDKNEVWHYRQQDAFIKALLLFKTNGFPHNSLMGRAEVLKQFPYDAAYSHVEDTELWTRMMMDNRKLRFANLPRVLTHYRIYGAQVSQRYRQEQEWCYQRILQRLLAFVMGRVPTEREWCCHCQLMLEQSGDPLVSHNEVAVWYQMLLENYEETFGDPFYVIDEKWFRYCQYFGLRSLYTEIALKRGEFCFWPAGAGCRVFFDQKVAGWPQNADK